MKVHEYEGDYAPSALLAELRDAGLDVLGVTQDADGGSVQVICDDDASEKAVAKVVAAHDPRQRELAEARERAADMIRAALAASDVWAARHVEDGVSLTPARIAYRQTLRALLDSVAASDDPAGITIPDPPPPPKT